MSTTYRTYVGPYLRCAVARITVPASIMSCTTPTCPSYAQDFITTRFCNRCGSPIQPRPTTKEADAVDAWGLSERLADRLTTPFGDAYDAWSIQEHAHLWMPNVAFPGDRETMHMYNTDYCNFALAPISDPRAETDAFVAAFAADIGVLRVAYGADAVTVAWGIIQDYY